MGSVIGSNTGTTIAANSVFALGSVCNGKAIGTGDSNSNILLRSEAFMRSSNFVTELGSSWKLIAVNGVTVPPVQTWQSGTALDIPLVYLVGRTAPNITYENGKITANGAIAYFRFTEGGYYINVTSINGKVSYGGAAATTTWSFTSTSGGELTVNGIATIEITKSGVKVPIDLGIEYTRGSARNLYYRLK